MAKCNVCQKTYSVDDTVLNYLKPKSSMHLNKSVPSIDKVQ